MKGTGNANKGKRQMCVQVKEKGGTNENKHECLGLKGIQFIVF